MLLKQGTRDDIERDNRTFIDFLVSSIFLNFSWEQALQTPEEATAPADLNGAAMTSTATSADPAGMQEEQQEEPEPTSPEHAEQEENEESEEA